MGATEPVPDEFSPVLGLSPYRHVYGLLHHCGNYWQPDHGHLLCEEGWRSEAGSCGSYISWGISGYAGILYQGLDGWDRFVEPRQSSSSNGILHAEKSHKMHSLYTYNDSILSSLHSSHRKVRLQP